MFKSLILTALLVSGMAAGATDIYNETSFGLVVSRQSVLDNHATNVAKTATIKVRYTDDDKICFVVSGTKTFPCTLDINPMNGIHAPFQLNIKASDFQAFLDSALKWSKPDAKAQFETLLSSAHPHSPDGAPDTVSFMNGPFDMNNLSPTSIDIDWNASLTTADGQVTYQIQDSADSLKIMSMKPKDCPIVSCGDCFAGYQDCTIIDCNGNITGHFSQNCND